MVGACVGGGPYSRAFCECSVARGNQVQHDVWDLWEEGDVWERLEVTGYRLQVTERGRLIGVNRPQKQILDSARNDADAKADSSRSLRMTNLSPALS